MMEWLQRLKRAKSYPFSCERRPLYWNKSTEKKMLSAKKLSSSARSSLFSHWTLSVAAMKINFLLLRWKSFLKYWGIFSGGVNFFTWMIWLLNGSIHHLCCRRMNFVPVCLFSWGYPDGFEFFVATDKKKRWHYWMNIVKPTSPSTKDHYSIIWWSTYCRQITSDDQGASRDQKLFFPSLISNRGI